MGHLGQLRLSQLRQLDLSSHYDVFYACVDPEIIVRLFFCSEHLRIFNLSDNGLKYPWERLRHKMRRLAKDYSEDARIVVHTGDGVTEVLEGGDGEGGDAEGDESDDEEECSGSYYSGSDDSWWPREAPPAGNRITQPWWSKCRKCRFTRYSTVVYASATTVRLRL